MQSKHIVIIVAIIAIASVACVFLITNNNNSDNDNVSDAVSGTYIYETHGKYNNGTDGYTGVWTLSYDDGKCILNTKNVQEVSPNLVGNGVGVPITQPIPSRPLGYHDSIPDKNGLLKNTEYIGGINVHTTNYGSMYLNVYKSGSTQYYCDNNGLIYRMISTISVNGSSVKAVFELT